MIDVVTKSPSMDLYNLLSKHSSIRQDDLVKIFQQHKKAMVQKDSKQFNDIVQNLHQRLSKSERRAFQNRAESLMNKPSFSSHFGVS